MGATLVGEKLEARAGSEDAQGNRRYTRVWQVTTDNASYGVRAVAAVLPVGRGDYYEIGVSGDAWYEVDSFAFVTAIDCKQTSEDGCEWDCTVEYGPADPEAVAAADPIDAPPAFSIAFEDREIPLDFDAAGDPIVNAALDKFDPPVTDEVSRFILVVERNETITDPAAFLATLATYKRTKNAGVFLGFAAGTVRFKTATLERQWNTLVGLYYRVRYEFYIDLDGWVRYILNAGMRELMIPAVGDPYHKLILDREGNPVGEPVPLNETGQVLPADGDPFFIGFEVYADADYSAFGF